jgi:hypothetical protein
MFARGRALVEGKKPPSRRSGILIAVRPSGNEPFDVGDHLSAECTP